MALRGVKKYVHSIREKSGVTLLDKTCYPWTVSATEINNKTAKIKIAPGSINGVVPSNISEGFSVSTAGTAYYIYCSVTAANGQITSCQLNVSATAPTGFGQASELPPTSFDVFIGSWAYGKALMATDNIYLEVYEAYRESKTPDFPGDRPYKSYYSWKKS